MAITFAVRTPYSIPNGRHIVRFRDATVLSWLQRVWESKLSAEELLGGDFYGGFGHLLESRISENLNVPKTNRDVVELLNKHAYCTHVKTKAGNFEIHTDDDEMYLCQYFFDSKFAAKNQNRTKYLTHKNWLPSRVKKPINSRPKTYLAARYPSQTCDSIYWDFFQVAGTRLETIGNIVDEMKQPKSFADCARLIQFLETVETNRSWQEIIQQLASSDSFANKLTQFKCSKHVCELNHHESTWPMGKRKTPVFTHLVVYDDLWAKTYPALVRSLKRMRRGNILFG